MPAATITVTVGAQTATVTIPEAAVDRIIPMVKAKYRQHHPGDDPTTLQSFLAGLWHRLRVDVRAFERETYVPEPLDMGGAPEGRK